MNQPRCVLLAAFALTALLVGSAIAQSTIDVSLNLRYTDPADPSEGGTFTMVAKTDDATGISAISAYLTGVEAGSIALQSGIGGMEPIYVMTFPTSVVNAVYGQDMTLPVVTGVGLSGSAGDVGSDPLNNSAWDNATAILTGSFGGTARPAFASQGSNSTGGNVFTSSTAPSAEAANLTTTVRGDSEISLGLETPSGAGLLKGDATRDFKVDGLDLAMLAGNFNLTGMGWDDADFNDDGKVDGLDLADMAANFNASSPGPTVSAIPEPAGIVLICLGLASVMFMRRRLG